MLYHISKIAGLKTLKPQVSTHKKAYVYAIENVVTGLLFGAPHDDFDFIISEENGIPVIMECYPDVFRLSFKGKKCSIYEISDEGFMRGVTSWSPEFVSENEVAVVREIAVNDLYSRLLDEESCGNLIIRRYEDAEDYKSIIAEHIVDRLVRFDAVYTEDKKIKKHYGKLLMHSRILWMGIYYSSFVSTILRSLRHGFCTSYMPLIPPMPWLCSFSRSFHLWPIAIFFSRRRCRRLWSIWMSAGTVGRGALFRKMLLMWCSRRVADSRILGGSCSPRSMRFMKNSA